MEQEAVASQYYQARSKQAVYGSSSRAPGREAASGLRSNAADSSARSERYTQGNAPSNAQRAHLGAQNSVHAEDVSQLQPTRVQSPQRGHDSRKATNGQQQFQPRRQRSYLPDADQSDGRPKSSPLIKDDRSQPLVSTSAKVAAHLRGGLTGASELDAMMTSGNDTMGNTEVFDPHALAAAAMNTTNASSAVFTPPVSSDQSAKHISPQQQSLRPPQADISRSSSGARGSSPGARGSSPGAQGSPLGASSGARGSSPGARGSSPGAQRSSLGARGSSQGARRSSTSAQGARGSSPGAGGLGVGYSSPGAHRGSSVSTSSSPGQQQQGSRLASPPRRELSSPPGPERKGSPSVLGRVHHRSPQQQPSAESHGSPACRTDSSTGASPTYKRAQSYSTRERVGTQNTNDPAFSPARKLSSHSSQREQELTAAADAAAHAWDGGITAARLAAHNAQSSRDSASQRTPLPPSGRSGAPEATSASRRGASPPALPHGNDPEPPSVPRPTHAPNAALQRTPSSRAPGAYLKQGSRARMEDYHQSGGEEDGSTGVGSRQSITAAIPPSLLRSDSRSRAAQQNSTSNSSAQHAEHAPHAQQPAAQASHIRMVPHVQVGHAHAEAPEATMPQQPLSPPSFPTYNMLDVSEDNSVTTDTATLLRSPNDRAVIPPWADDGQRRSATDAAHPPEHQRTHAPQMHAPIPLHGAPSGHPRPPSPPPAAHVPAMHAQHAYSQNMSPPQSQPKMYAPPVDRIAGGKAHPHAQQMHAAHASGMAPPKPQIQHQQHFPAPHPGTDSSIATVPYDAVEVGGGAGGASSSRPNTQSTIPNGDVMRPSTVMTIPNDNETRPGTISVQMPGTASTVPYNDAPESPVARPHTAATVQYSPPPTVDPIIAGMHVAPGGSAAAGATAAAAAAAAAAAEGSSESPEDIARRAARRRGPHPANPTAIAMEKQSAAEAALFARSTHSHLPQNANNPRTVGSHASASRSAGGEGEPSSTSHPHGAPQHGVAQQHQHGVQGSPIRQQVFDTNGANGTGDRPMNLGALESMEGSDMHSLHAYTHHTKATVMTAPVAAAFDDGGSGASGPHGHSSNACSAGIDGGSSAVFGTPPVHTNGHVSDYPLSGITSPGAEGATGRRNVKQSQYSQRTRPPSAGAASTISDAPRFIPPHSPRGGGGGGGYKYDSQSTLPERMPSYQMSTADYSGNAVLNGATPGWIPAMGGPSHAELSPAGDVSTGTTRPGVGPGWFTPPPGPGPQPTVSSTPQPQDPDGAMHAAHAPGDGSAQFDHSRRVMRDAAPGLYHAEVGPSFRGDTAEGAHASGTSDFHPRAGSHASSVHGPSCKHATHASQHQYSGYTHSGAPVGSHMHDTAYAHSGSHPGSSMTDYQVGSSQKNRVTHHEQPPGDVTCMELMYRPRVVVYMAIFIAVLLLIIIILFVALFAT